MQNLNGIIAENSYREIFGEPTKSRNKELKKDPKIEEDLSKKESKDKGDAAEDKDDVREEHDWKDTEIGRLCVVVQEDVKIKKEEETLKEEADDKVIIHAEKPKPGRLKCEECNTTFVRMPAVVCGISRLAAPKGRAAP